ncbi:thyrotropin-releasing hormone-degrading ectoenzyme-like [Odontomachus brunneus]|uniref:thyrotropin-releasing hormone-degrading ectoenzyme-like n=1 Tax=Odontomachus brunneus TaxID=486640 RepID=UPI0013F220C9|nr:thyrotropin-releasing hormone-degrading ectoenzyme-like [Odontomachus brunneus]XP_032685890.1 thyrotropin-releasing hormone-degrading ectoenzyme-like [Odontomachus brunneus]
MVSLRLLLSTAVLFAVKVISSDFDCETSSVNDNIPFDEMAPIFYKIDLNITNNSVILGHSNILLKVHHTIRRISLHANELNITTNSIMLNTINTMADIPNIGYIPYQINYCSISQILELNFKDDIYPGMYDLSINFQLPVNLSSYDKFFWLSTIQNELNSPRNVFPCWDNLGANARFIISVKHSKYQNALSNMRISRIVFDENETETNFAETPIIALRKVAIAVIDYAIDRQTNLTSEEIIWCRPEVDDYLKYFIFAIEECKTTYKTYIGKTFYKTTKFKSDHVLVPNAPMKIMGYPGLIIYREQDFTYNEDSDYPGHKSNILNLVGQEMARQWFNRETSPPSWADVLFNEVIASFLNHILTEKLQNKTIQDLYAVQMMQSAFHHDSALKIKHVLHKIDSADKIERDLYFRMYCNKGAALIRMLYYLFSPNDFHTAMQMYFTHNNYTGSFELTKLWNVLQRVLDMRDKKWVFSLDKLTDMWLNLQSYPEVYVDRLFSNNSVIISKHDTSIIPITYITQSNLISGLTWNFTWLSGNEKKNISGIAEDDFILINMEQTGYYRVHYDFDSWQRIYSYLKSKDHTVIHVNNRAQLIDDAFYFAMQRRLSPTFFMSLILHLLDYETDYIVCYPVFNILARMSTYFELPEGRSFKGMMGDFLASLLTRIGYEERSDESDMTKSLRLLAVRWACKLDSLRCKNAARIKLIEHLNEPDKPISPWWKEWVYCTGMNLANISLWQKWMDRCIKERNSTCLTYLSCVDTKDVISYYLDYLTETLMYGNFSKIYKFINKTEKLTLFHTLFRKQAKHNDILSMFVNRQDKIIKTIYRDFEIDPVKLLIEVMGNIYSQDGFDMMTMYAKRLKFKSATQERQFHDLIRFRIKILARVATQFYIF